jgi:chondroitin AC lyase
VQAPGELDPETVRDFGERAFAGGASDGSVGCAAMDFSRGNLSIRRAWFCFEEGVVALGAGLSCTDPHPVRTTLNQCHWRGPATLNGIDGPLATGEYPLTAGSVIQHEGVAYRILDGAGSLRLGEQSGAWSDCGVGSDALVTLPVLNAGLDHGIRPQGASFAYAISFDGDLPAEILENTPALQAVWSGGRGHAVFYEPGAITFSDGQRLTVDRPCIVLYHPANGRATLTLAQPAQEAGMLALQLSGPVQADISVSLPEHEYAGSSVSIIVG